MMEIVKNLVKKSSRKLFFCDVFFLNICGTDENRFSSAIKIFNEKIDYFSTISERIVNKVILEILSFFSIFLKTVFFFNLLI